MNAEDRAKLVAGTAELGPSVAAWYEEQSRELVAARDEMVRIAAKACEVAASGTMIETLVIVARLDDEEFEITGNCTIADDLHSAFPIDDDDLREEIARMAKGVVF